MQEIIPGGYLHSEDEAVSGACHVCEIGLKLIYILTARSRYEETRMLNEDSRYTERQTYRSHCQR